MVEVDERILGPQTLLNFLAGDDVAGALEQESENLKRLLLQSNADTAFAELAGAHVELEVLKSDDAFAPGLGHRPRTDRFRGV